MIRRAVTALILIAAASPTRSARSAEGAEYRSPVALGRDRGGRTVYVAQSGNSRIAVVDTASDTVLREITVPQPPGDLLVDGPTLYVTDAAARGTVYVVDRRTGDIERRIPAGNMPRSPVLSPDGRTLCVLNRFLDRVLVIDIATGETRRVIRLPREPIDAVLAPDGETLLVLNHLPAGSALDELVAAEVTFVDTSIGEITASVKLPNGSTSGREICLSPDGRFAFCTHILARFHNPTTQLIRGWMNTNALSILDVHDRTLYATILLDDVDRGAANPWAVACSDDGRVLAVTHAGTQEVSLIDLPALLTRLAGLGENGRAEVSMQLSYLGGLRRRVPLTGNGPRAAVFAGHSLYVAEFFSDSLCAVAPADPSTGDQEARAVSLGPNAVPDTARIGEMFFNDASLCFQNWQSCASCHPDTRADALNWDLLNDGFGNPKNTKSLLLAHETPPAMITGIRASAEVAVRAGIRHIQFARRPEQDLNAIDEYLRALKPMPSPWLVDGELSPAAKRGEAVFSQANCGACHTGPYFTDQELYRLGMTRGQDEGRSLDTPTLIELWRTAPYLHDGRAPDLRSLLTDHNRSDRHGRTSTLTEQELSDLIAYLKSL